MYGLDPIGGDGQKAGGLAVPGLHQTELGQVEECAVLGAFAGGGEGFGRSKSGQRTGRTKIPIMVQPDIFSASQRDLQVGYGLVADVRRKNIIKSLPIHIRRDLEKARLVPVPSVGHAADEEGWTAGLPGEKGDAVLYLLN